MPVSDEISARLVAAFAPTRLEIVDESELHRGHAGYRDGGESHFRITIRSAVFATMSRVERHRAIHRAMGPDLIGRIHALALDVGG